jgi:type I restriction enzyme M protein
LESTKSLSSLIWASADDVLRGMFKPSEYGSVILPFVVMRRLDCVLEKQKNNVIELHNTYKNKLKDTTPIIVKKIGLPFFNTSKYDLNNLKSDPNNIYKNFQNYVNGYSRNVFEIIENFALSPLVEKLHKNKSLYLLIDKFTEFDLHPNKIDNHQMGSIYEELLRRFSEMSNEESGDHFTPRDIVKLLVNLVFGGDEKDLKGKGKIRSIYDPCCGTGGMLTIGKEWILENINSDLKLDLYGQELNDVTFAICKSDFLMLNENPENVHGPVSSLSDDRLEGRKFDYMLTNPPFGISWKKDEEFVRNEAKDPNGRFFVGTPKISDSSLLFLQHLIHKMNPTGSRIGIIFNGSPLFNGDAGSGESEIRKWILENDLLETIIMLPDKLFFNTGITTYIWIVTNRKITQRKNKVQLIDASEQYVYAKKKLGEKSKEISDDQIEKIFTQYKNFEVNEYSKIMNNSDFGYIKTTIDLPKMKNEEIQYDTKSKMVIDKSLRFHEYIPLNAKFDEYLEKEVKPFIPIFVNDRSLDKIGYEISLTKLFYKYNLFRDVKDVKAEIDKIDEELERLNKLL